MNKISCYLSMKKLNNTYQLKKSLDNTKKHYNYDFIFINKTNLITKFYTHDRPKLLIPRAINFSDTPSAYQMKKAQTTLTQIKTTTMTAN